MMKRILNIIACLFLFTLGVNAQSNDYTEKMKEVNKIKSNKNYLTSMGTSTKSFDDAFENAKSLLGLEVETWLAEKKETDVAGYVAKSREYFMQLDMQRGNLYRVFVYVRKKNILPVYKEDDVLIKGIGEKEESTKTTETVKVVREKDSEEKPVITVQETEQPSKTSKTSKNNKTDEMSSTGQQTVVQTTEEHKAATIIQENETAPTAQEPAFQLTSDEKEMLFVKNFDEISIYIKNNSITQYGKYATMPKEGTFHIFIYNRKGQVSACLRFDNSKQINIATGKQDDVANYKGCGAFWIKK